MGEERRFDSRTRFLEPTRTIAATIAAAAVFLGGVVTFQTDATAADAAVASDFDSGNIISDALFFDGQAMSAGQVQAFLDSQVPACRAGYTCLENYIQSTPSRAAEAGRCSAYGGAPNENAPTIIYRVGAVCGVSQKAILVLLQKEQSLVTDDWPTDRQYRSAMGYGCPDEPVKAEIDAERADEVMLDVEDGHPAVCRWRNEESDPIVGGAGPPWGSGCVGAGLR